MNRLTVYEIDERQPVVLVWFTTVRGMDLQTADASRERDRVRERHGSTVSGSVAVPTTGWQQCHLWGLYITSADSTWRVSHGPASGKFLLPHCWWYKRKAISHSCAMLCAPSSSLQKNYPVNEVMCFQGVFWWGGGAGCTIMGEGFTFVSQSPVPKRCTNGNELSKHSSFGILPTFSQYLSHLKYDSIK